MSRRVDLTPAARRLVREFGRQVLAGRLRTGMALPTLRTLAAEKRLSVFPVQQALKYIERQGWAHRPENGRGLLIADDALVRARELLEETPPPVINLVSPLHGRVHLEHVFMAYIPGFSAVFPRCSIRRVYVEPDHAIDTVTQLLHENATLACEVGYVLAGMVRAVMEVLRFQEAACVVAGFADPETNLPCVYEDMNEIGSLAGGLLCRTEPVVTLYERELVGAEVNLIDGFRRAARMGRAFQAAIMPHLKNEGLRFGVAVDGSQVRAWLAPFPRSDASPRHLLRTHFSLRGPALP